MNSQLLNRTVKTINAYGQTDVGLKRKNNEDDLFILRSFQEGKMPTEERVLKGLLFIVADGVGGESYGEIASKRTVEGIRDHYYGEYAKPRQSVEERARLLEDILIEVNEEVYEEAERLGAAGHMGSTAVVASITPQDNGSYDVAYAWLGDSRIYHIPQQAKPRQLTIDHTFANDPKRRGRAGINDIRAENTLSRSVGGTFNADPDSGVLRVRKGDSLVLVSDGVTRYFEHIRDVAKITKTAPDAQTAVKRFIDQSKKRGGEDNITALVVRFYPPEAVSENPTEYTKGATSFGLGWGKQKRDDKNPLTNDRILLGLSLVAAFLVLSVIVLSFSGSGGEETPTVAPTVVEGVPTSDIVDSQDSEVQVSITQTQPASQPATVNQTSTMMAATAITTQQYLDNIATNAARSIILTAESATQTMEANGTATALAEADNRVSNPTPDNRTFNLGDRFTVIRTTNRYINADRNSLPRGSIPEGTVVRVVLPPTGNHLSGSFVHIEVVDASQGPAWVLRDDLEPVR